MAWLWCLDRQEVETETDSDLQMIQFGPPTNDRKGTQAKPSITQAVNCAKIHPSGRAVAAASTDGVVYLWDMDRKAVIECLVGHTGSVMSVAFTPDGCGLVSGGFDGIICYWDLTELNSRLSSTNSETTTGIEGRPNEAEEVLCTMTWDSRVSELSFRKSLQVMCSFMATESSSFSCGVIRW